MAQEVELKLSFPQEALAQILRHTSIATASKVGKTETLINTYFDTPELALRQERIAVRTRRAGRRWLQTVKCASSSRGGLSSRPEWEQPYVDQQFDFSAIDDVKVRTKLERVQAALQACFTTEFKRETRRAVLPNGASILLMIDQGFVAAGSKRMPIYELELELERGQANDVLDFAVQLADDLPLMPQDISKAQRGFLLMTGDGMEPARAKDSPIRSGLSTLDAFRALAVSILFDWQANAAGAQETGDIDFIHQLRVALRRLRTALQLFAPCLPEDFVARWSIQLKELARSAGHARDLQVLRQSIIEPALSDTQVPGSAALFQRLDSELAQAMEQTQQGLRSAGTGAAILRFSRELTELTQTEGPPLDEFAQTAVKRLRKRCRKRVQRAAQTEASDDLHELRISLKRLRYGLEFFAPLFNDKNVRRTLKGVRRVQSELGMINDVSVAQATLSRWAADDASLAHAHGFIAGWHAQSVSQLRSKAVARTLKLLWADAPWQRASGKSDGAAHTSRKEK